MGNEELTFTFEDLDQLEGAVLESPLWAEIVEIASEHVEHMEPGPFAENVGEMVDSALDFSGIERLPPVVRELAEEHDAEVAAYLTQAIVELVSSPERRESVQDFLSDLRERMVKLWERLRALRRERRDARRGG